MSYQNLDKRAPPATAPKPKAYTPAPTPFKPGGGSYRPINVDTFPPPPPQPGSSYGDDERGFPLPPAPDSIRGYTYPDPEHEFPPPPPPAPTHEYTYTQVTRGGGGGHSGIYTAQAKYIRTDDYIDDFGPGPMTPPSQRNEPGRTIYSHDGRGSPYSGSNYANIRINVAPPTPTSKEFDYGMGKQASPQYRAEPVIIDSRHDRPLPGPQVPSGMGKGAGGSVMYGSQVSPKEKGDKEAEVDALTNMLMKSMESAGQEDFWGICGRCEKEVTGEHNGCSAMDQIYHINCFTCTGCNTRLQGKSFFAMENKPYCENCYINTLERCSVCSKPITDRLLRATGKPYHPDCFTCVVCGKSLDGIPFTVDATNQIHCIDDFHKKFAPRCCVCQKPIMPRHGEDETIRIVALDKSFHVECYRCEDCGLLLSSEAEGRGCYPLDEHILCKNCNATRIQTLTTKMATEL